MCSFLCSWDDSSSVSSGLSDTLDNLSTDDLNTTSSVSSYSNITASSRKNTHAQVSSFAAVCCNTPMQDRKSLVSMPLNKFISLKILYYTWMQEAIDSIDPALSCELTFQIPCSQGMCHCWRCWLGETQLCPLWGTPTVPSPYCTLTQNKYNMIGSVIMDFYSLQLIWSISFNR